MERYRGRRKKGYRRMDDKYLQNLVNDTVIRITKKMTGVSMQAVEAPANRSRHNPVLKILITDGGRGQVTALYSTSNSAFHKIADGMKRRPVEDEAEMVVYIKEYFNVLCGNIISRINREKKASFRFGVPSYHEQGFEKSENPFIEMVYDMDGGRIRISWIGAGF